MKSESLDEDSLREENLKVECFILAPKKLFFSFPEIRIKKLFKQEKKLIAKKGIENMKYLFWNMEIF